MNEEGENIMLKAADYRARARESLSGNWGMAVLVCFLGTLLGGIETGTPVMINFRTDQDTNIQSYVEDLSSNFFTREMLSIIFMMLGIFTIYALAKFIIGGAVELGICAYFSKRALGEEADVKDEFSYFKYFGKALGLRVVMSVFIFLWSLLFVVPGIIAAYRYAMATYIMAEHPQMGIMEAIDASKQMMDGNKWSLFCLEFSFIGWAFLCVFTCGIGDLFLTPYTQMATAHFYMNLSRGSGNFTNNDEM